MEREFQIHRSDEDYALAEFYRWAIAFLIGVSMGCLGFIVDWGIETLNNFKYNNTFDVVNSQGARARSSRHGHRQECTQVKDAAPNLHAHKHRIKRW